jgi:hypothetical protein
LRCKGRHIFNTNKRKTSFFHKKLFFLIFISFILEIKDFTLSLQPQNDGAIAQLVEQRTENPCVPGSIPGGTTFTKRKIMKTAEIQTFQRFFLYVLPAKTCNLVQ